MIKPGKLLNFIIILLVLYFVSVLDYVTGYELSFSLFYLLPITLSVYFFSSKSAYVISFLSSCIWYIIDVTGAYSYSSPSIPVWNAIIRLVYFSLHTFLFSHFIILFRQTKEKTFTDYLTEIGNSLYFDDYLKRTLLVGKREPKPLTLAYIDFDNFKSVNDTYGHLTGNELLKTLASAMASAIRPSDIIARMGGDEFAVLLVDADYDNSELILRRIISTTEKIIKNNKWPVSLSIGAITFFSDKHEPDDLISQADNLMYKVKKQGKNGMLHISL